MTDQPPTVPAAKTGPSRPKPQRASAELASLFDSHRGAERIAKRLARAGLCSRREAERWIADGRVAVDDAVLDSPAVTVDENSRIVVDGQPIPVIEPPRLWRFHKPRGTVTTTRDPEGRPTVFARLPADLPRVMTVGRLDFDSEGLLLLTNDGALARHLELPSTGWLRRYRARVYGTLNDKALAGLKRGVTVDGIDYGPIEVTVDRLGKNSWLTIGLREGKNREVRRVMEHLGLTVSRLIRISYGPFQLGDVAEAGVEEIKTRVLKDQLGIATLDDSGHAKAKARLSRPPPPGRGSKGGKDKPGKRATLSLKPSPGGQRADRRRKTPGR
ncbi:MAG: rRNA pseudouridine synthase [Alphaproteobacteria bacterium]|nr:rRNA pseudouridine synthase [Alphaproteobacteria bacterium]